MATKQPEQSKTIRRAPISQRATNYVRDLYLTVGWQVQMSPRGSITSFTASKDGKKLHHVRVIFGEDTWAEGEKVNFNQNAVANRASAIVATYTEVTAKDGTITQKTSLFDVNENRPIRLVMPRAAKDAGEKKEKS